MSVISLHPNADLAEFFEFLWGDLEGYVYSPTKHPETGDWEQNYFEWPTNKKELIEHVTIQGASVEVYVAPALFNSASALKADLKYTQVLWAEVDGSPLPPNAWETVPYPSRRIQTSLEGHEHFYWRLSAPVADPNEIEQYTRGLTYFLGADSSGWDCNQVLRPPTTINHKRNKPVLTLSTNASVFSINDFVTVPAPKQLVRESIDTEDIPDLTAVVATYKWEPDDFQFFRKREIPEGSRSSAMMRLGYICAEMRMSDEAAFAVLYNADERWGKFKNRSDRERRLLDIINRARLKYPIEPEVETPDELQIFGWEDFMSLELHVDWIIPGILQRQGVAMLTGPPKAGKTQITLQFAKHMALGRDFLGWNIGTPRKIIFFSMEMGPADLKYFMDQMNSDLTPEERELLQNNFLIVPLGHGLLLDTPVDQQKIEKYLDKIKPDGIIIDSLSVITEESTSEERSAKQIMNYIARIKQRYDLFVWFIHHNRKAQVNNKKPNKLDDVYGSQHYTRQATTVIGVWKQKNGEIELNCLAVRLSADFDSFTVARTKEGLNFVRVDNALTSLASNTVFLGPRKEDLKNGVDATTGTPVGAPNLSM